MPRCHNCGSPYHRIADCKSSSKRQNCYNCNQPGHHRDRCPFGEGKHIICYKCRQPGHYSDKCPNQAVPPPPSGQPSTQRNFRVPSVQIKPFKVTLKFDGWWGAGRSRGDEEAKARSAFLHPDCELFQIKKALITRLLEEGLISEDDLDQRNQVPHVQLRERGEDSQAYENLNNRTMTISALKIHGSYIEVDVGLGKHVTLFYKKDFFKTINQEVLTSILSDILEPYTLSSPQSSPEEQKQGIRAGMFDFLKNMLQAISPSSPEIKQPEEKASDGPILSQPASETTCVVCMDAPQDALIEPCNHLLVCTSCVLRLINCPKCRGRIVSSKKIFIN